MKLITRASVMNFWVRQLNSQREVYRDECGEKQYTLMAEQAAEHFDIATENGQSPLEEDIAQWATEMHF